MSEKIINAYKKKCSWIDMLQSESESISVSFKNSRLHSVRSRQTGGCGIRVNINGKTGFSFTNDPSRLNETAETASALATFSDPETFIIPSDSKTFFEPFAGGISGSEENEYIKIANESVLTIASRFPKAMTDIGISKSSGKVRIINSSGLDVSYRSSAFSASVSTTIIQDDGSRLDVWEGLSSLSEISIESATEKVIQKISSALTEGKTSSGRMPVIFTPKAFSNIIGILTSGLNARPVWKGISPFAKSIGEKKFSSIFTLTDDPHIFDSPYSFPFDDEGVQGIKRTLVENGIVKDFVSDLKHAEKLGLRPGNASRGYSSLPSPSFSNLIVSNGSTPFSKIISETKLGIIADQFLGLGQSNTLNGNFSANLDLGYLVENGEIRGRVKDCMISGNLFDILAEEIILSLETEKYGSAVLPYIFFPEINFTSKK